MAQSQPAHPAVDVLTSIHHDRYSLDELSAILNMSRFRIAQAVHNGYLHAFVLNHRIIWITRDDAIDWLRRREMQA
jgi:hypothetical protein